MSEQEQVEICNRCKCCETSWVDCYDCDEGYSYHDCGEDTCCCLNPAFNVICDICDGKGGWMGCTCDENGKHK